MKFQRFFGMLALSLVVGCASAGPQKTTMAPEGSDAKAANLKGPDGGALNRLEMEKQIAANAGLLGALSDQGSMDNIFGSSGLDSELTGGIGGLIGSKGTEIGSGGLGMSGSGLGGGGTAEGLGGLGTKGLGSGVSGYGRGGGGAGSVGPKVTAKVVMGKVTVRGGLDKDIVRRILRRNMTRFRYCYERELVKDPNIKGKAVFKFSIDAKGVVTTVSVVSKKDLPLKVEQCIQIGMRRMRFPHPTGGTAVSVEQPMTFSSDAPATP